MNKSYQKHLLIVLSAISVSLTGMETDQQNSQLRQSDSNTWVIQPLGGYIPLNSYNKQDIRNFYNDNTIEQTIHFTPVDNGTKTTHPIYKILTSQLLSTTVPLNLFTENGKSYTVSDQNNNTYTIISNRLHNKTEFISNDKYWQNVYNIERTEIFK